MNKLFQSLRFLSAYARLVQDTGRLDVVFQMLDGATDSDAGGAFEAFAGRPEVQELVRRDPPPLVIDLAALRQLPAGTVGREFAAFIDVRGFDIGDLYRHGTAPGSDIERIKVHFERSHDLWHLVTGFDTDVAGELGLQAFYLSNAGTPVGLAILSAGLLNTLLKHPGDMRRRLAAIANGWRHGELARPLFGLDWAAWLDRPLAELRAELGITDAMVREAGDPAREDVALAA